MGYRELVSYCLAAGLLIEIQPRVLRVTFTFVENACECDNFRSASDINRNTYLDTLSKLYLNLEEQLC